MRPSDIHIDRYDAEHRNAAAPASARHAADAPGHEERTTRRDEVDFYDYKISPAARNAHPDEPFEATPGSQETGEKPGEADRTRGKHRPARKSTATKPLPHPPLSARTPIGGPQGRDRQGGRQVPPSPVSIDNVLQNPAHRSKSHSHADVYVSHNGRASWTEAAYKPSDPQPSFKPYIIGGIIVAALIAGAALAFNACADEEIPASTENSISAKS